jgi:8-oxo-dGTP pyrophosphatase MutT (NUDIX family)
LDLIRIACMTALMPVVEAKPSATLILLRDTTGGMETLLLKRHQDMAFGGSWVFPGGKIDPQDYVKAETSPARYEEKQHADPAEVSAAYHAAVRESREEAGIDMDEQRLVLLSCWTTPVLGDRPRFRTWFFVGEIGQQPIVVDGKEMLDYRWILVSEAITTKSVRELNLFPPTYNTLIEINRYPDVRTTLTALRDKPLQVYNPKLLPFEGGYISLYEGDAGYESGDIHASGKRHRLVVDQDGYHLEKPV